MLGMPSSVIRRACISLAHAREGRAALSKAHSCAMNTNVWALLRLASAQLPNTLSATASSTKRSLAGHPVATDE